MKKGEQRVWQSPFFPRAGFASLGCMIGVLLAPWRGYGAPPAATIIDRAVDNQVFNLAGAEMQITIVLRDKSGHERTQKMFTKTQQKQRLNRTLTRFISPSDVMGTAFLFLENKDREDDQHMYLPALKVVKRIVGSQKNASFMGSDFTYSDLEAREYKKASYKILPEEKVAGAACYVIDTFPRNKEYYSRLRSWIRKKDFVFLRTQFFDKKGQLLKVLFVKEIKKVGQQKVPTRVKLTNQQTGHSTQFLVSAIKIRTDFPDEDFTIRAMK